jgi:nucleoside-diphosphate-sugar epimerase
MMSLRGTYLVTGGTGEIGFEVIRQLRARGVSVRALVRNPAKAAGIAALGAELAAGDLTDRASCLAACAGVSGVFHLGALYRETGLPVEQFMRVNRDGVQNIFETAIEQRVPRLIHCSTGGVLGDVKDPPGRHDSPYSPGDPYQVSKVEGEKLALEFYRSGKISGVIIRPAMVYGPGDTRHLKLFRAVARQRFLYIGDGRKFVHFIDIRDLARSFLIAMEKSDLNGEIYHIAGERPMLLREACEEIARQAGVPAPKIRIPALPVQLLGSACEIVCKPFGIKPPIYRRRVDFFTKSRYFDTEKAKLELGFTPAQPFSAEVKDTIEHFRRSGLI